MPSSLHFSLATHILLLLAISSSFQGLKLLHEASQKREEAQKLEEEAQQLETEGWGNIREAVAGSEAESIYGLLRGVTLYSHFLLSQPPLKRSCLTPSSSISQLPSQKSTGPEASDPAGQAMVSASPAATPAPQGDVPAHMQPLRIQVGGAKHVYQCWVEGCKESPSTSQAAICALVRRVHLGVRLVCSLHGKTFFNPDMLKCHKKS